jgi:hypothetical protein
MILALASDLISRCPLQRRHEMRQCAGLHSLCACAMRTLLNSNKCTHRIACSQPVVENILHKMHALLQATDIKSRAVAAPWQIALQHETTESRSRGFTGHLETIQEILAQSSNGRLTASQLPS